MSDRAIPSNAPGHEDLSEEEDGTEVQQPVSEPRSLLELLVGELWQSEYASKLSAKLPSGIVDSDLYKLAGIVIRQTGGLTPVAGGLGPELLKCDGSTDLTDKWNTILNTVKLDGIERLRSSSISKSIETVFDKLKVFDPALQATKAQLQETQEYVSSIADTLGHFALHAAVNGSHTYLLNSPTRYVGLLIGMIALMELKSRGYLSNGGTDSQHQQDTSSRKSSSPVATSKAKGHKPKVKQLPTGSVHDDASQPLVNWSRGRPA